AAADERTSLIIMSAAGNGGVSRARGPIAAAKTIVINRTPAAAVATTSRRGAGVGIGSFVDLVDGATAAAAVRSSSAELSSVLTGRQKEKQEMRELNERFASYTEKVRFLEAQNRKLSEELRKLRESWGKETEKVKQLYECELQQMRRLLEEAEQYKAGAEVRVTSMGDQLSELQQLLDEANRQRAADREAADRLSQQVSDAEAETSLLRRRVAAFGEERARDQAETKRLRQEVARLRQDLDSETLGHINAENSVQSLREELEFQRALHESELKELAALAYRDTTGENREFWKAEMAQALSDIRREYDSKLEAARSEVESQYSLRVQEARAGRSRDSAELTRLREENKRLKSHQAASRSRLPELEARSAQLERELDEIRREAEDAERQFEMEHGRLRAELAGANATLEEYLAEVQSLTDAKLSLELEIHAYRKLLEGEEIRLNNERLSRESVSTRLMEREQTVSTTEQRNQGSARQQINILKGEMSAKTTYQRTAKGSTSIQDCGCDGKLVTLEFTGKKKEDLSDWTLVRNIDNGRQVVKYTFPKGTVLDTTCKTIKIWAAGQKPPPAESSAASGGTNTGIKELEAAEPSWGIGSNILTTLANADGEERATHIQKTTYSAS
ncbi:hypothetical protein BOX15_Mlig001101g1, partial [Macrostomum lignano]